MPMRMYLLPVSDLECTTNPTAGHGPLISSPQCGSSPAFVLWLWRWWDFRAFRNDYGVPVRRILITGMSGTGKSTVVSELAARGHRAIDLDSDTWSEWVRVDGNPTG